MDRYTNKGGDSNVVAYEVLSDGIRVKFGDGSIYVYTNGSAGHANIATMHRLARAGQGLNSFINTTVRKRYSHKEF